MHGEKRPQGIVETGGLIYLRQYRVQGKHGNKHEDNRDSLASWISS